MLRTLAATTAVACMLTTAALAAPDDLTGTGGGPATAAKAPYTASTGATVPRPGARGESGNGGIDQVDRQDRARNSADDKILNGICIGCSPK